MRRIDDLSVIRQPRRRRLPGGRWVIPFVGVSALLVSSLVGLELRANVADDDKPELTPPTGMPVTTPPQSGPAPAGAAKPRAAGPGGRAVLALPGIGGQGGRATGPTITSTPSTTPSPSVDLTPGEPSLDAPLEMRGVPVPSRPPTTNSPDPLSRPLVLEKPDGEDSKPVDPPGSHTGPSTKRSATTPRVDPSPAPTQTRRPRLFGLLPAPAPAQTPTPTPKPGQDNSATRTSPLGRSVVDDVREDSAAESALKRRIERQAREAIGDRARSVEVRVQGKSAVVMAHGVKFYQKRAVRKSLESIPALSGLRSTIEVVD